MAMGRLGPPGELGLHRATPALLRPAAACCSKLITGIRTNRNAAGFSLMRHKMAAVGAHSPSWRSTGSAVSVSCSTATGPTRPAISLWRCTSS